MIISGVEKATYAECIFEVQEAQLIARYTSRLSAGSLKLLNAIVSGTRVAKPPTETISILLSKRYLETTAEKLVALGEPVLHPAPAHSPMVIEFAGNVRDDAAQCLKLGTQICDFLTLEDLQTVFTHDVPK